MAREIVNKYTTITFEGDCPRCGRLQKADYKRSVDILCGSCDRELTAIRKEELSSKLNDIMIGGVITGFVGDVDNLDYVYFNKDEKSYVLELIFDSDGDVSLEVSLHEL